MLSVIFGVLWVSVGIAASYYVAYSSKFLSHECFNTLGHYGLSRGYDDRAFQFFMGTLISLVLGPFLWAYVVYKIHKKLKCLIDIEKPNELERFIDEVIDLEHYKTN